MKNEGTPTGDEYFPNIWDWESELFKIFQMSFSNRMLFMNIGHLSCSPDPTANSKTTNPNFHKIFGQFICNLIGYKGQLISKCPCDGHIKFSKKSAANLFVGLLENLTHQKDIVKLTNL